MTGVQTCALPIYLVAESSGKPRERRNAAEPKCGVCSPVDSASVKVVARLARRVQRGNVNVPLAVKVVGARDAHNGSEENAVSSKECEEACC